MSIEFCSVSKTFNEFKALDNVSLKIESGELVSLLGPSGCGKTTLLRMIAGMDTADPGSGAIYFDGRDVSGREIGKRRIGFVFQHYALFKHMSVFENIAFGLRAKPRRLRPRETDIRAKVGELLQLVQLQNFAARYPSQLSGGQRQRVALARALAVEPSVLLLDEPFGALDATVRRELRRWLRKLHERIRVTTILVTHDQEEALEVSDRVAVMNKGRIEQFASPGEIYENPANPFVFKFLGSYNLFRARKAFAGDTAAVPVDTSEVTLVRPHDVAISRDNCDGAGIAATIKHITFTGSAVNVELARADNEEPIDAALPAHDYKDLGLKSGDRVFIRLRNATSFAEDTL
ncbi:MAG: sulfate ABC transporter ATP-binding protein, partial [Methylocapsa sp.]|nr:sulfate ABC transporter ATP-binding protein [Methylocapsa sp.]